MNVKFQTIPGESYSKNVYKPGKIGDILSLVEKKYALDDILFLISHKKDRLFCDENEQLEQIAHKNLILFRLKRIEQSNNQTSNMAMPSSKIMGTIKCLKNNQKISPEERKIHFQYSSVLNKEPKDLQNRINQLAELGYDHDDCLEALRQNNYDVNRAAQYIAHIFSKSFYRVPIKQMNNKENTNKNETSNEIRRSQLNTNKNETSNEIKRSQLNTNKNETSNEIRRSQLNTNKKETLNEIKRSQLNTNKNETSNEKQFNSKQALSLKPKEKNKSAFPQKNMPPPINLEQHNLIKKSTDNSDPKLHAYIERKVSPRRNPMRYQANGSKNDVMTDSLTKKQPNLFSKESSQSSNQKLIEENNEKPILRHNKYFQKKSIINNY